MSIDSEYHAWLKRTSKALGMSLKDMLEGVLNLAMQSSPKELKRRIETAKMAKELEFHKRQAEWIEERYLLRQKDEIAKSLDIPTK